VLAVVKVVAQAQHIVRVGVALRVQVAQQLDLVQALVDVVLDVLDHL